MNRLSSLPWCASTDSKPLDGRVMEEYGVKYEDRHEIGHAAQELVRVAETGNFDLVVIGSRGLGGFQQNQDPRPYDRVITKDAKSKTGVFTVHLVKNNWYYEIPKSELGKEFLWVNQISKTAVGHLSDA